MALCGQTMLPTLKGPLGTGKMHNVNHADLELPPKRFNLRVATLRDREQVTYLRKFPFYQDRSKYSGTTVGKCSFYLAFLLVPSSLESQIWPWGHAE